MKELTTHAHAAKLIRAELKRRGSKGSVRSSIYAGGSSVHADVYEDLRPEAREELDAWCKQFQQGHFDGMVDLYEYSNRRDDLPQVKYVFLQVRYSAEACEAAKAMTWDDMTESHAQYMALTKNYGGFWDRFEEAHAAGGHWRSSY